MKRYAVVMLSLLAISMFFACSSDDVVDPTELTPPSNLRVTGLPLTGAQADMAWDGAVGSEDVVYTGYRIYANTTSIQSLDNASELAPYQIMEVSSSTQSTTVDLGDSYTYYYVHVRAVTDDAELSRASNEVYFIARPEEQGAVVYEFATPAGDPSGYDLSAGVAVSMATSNPDRHDMTDFYLGYANGITGGGELYLWDPKSASADYQNSTGFAGVSEAFDQLDEAPAGATYSDHVAVTEGSVIVVRITDEMAVTNYAKLSFTNVEGTEPDRTLVFQWAFQPADGRPEFVPAP